jgi:hypothetical protein
LVEPCKVKHQLLTDDAFHVVDELGSILEQQILPVTRVLVSLFELFYFSIGTLFIEQVEPHRQLVRRYFG